MSRMRVNGGAAGCAGAGVFCDQSVEPTNNAHTSNAARLRDSNEKPPCAKVLVGRQIRSLEWIARPLATKELGEAPNLYFAVEFNLYFSNRRVFLLVVQVLVPIVHRLELRRAICGSPS
jgi:hypothetical protein